MSAVHRRDHDERDDVVDHDDGQHERPQAIGESWAYEREHPERERGVRRHRGAPAVRARTSGVGREVDADRDGHAAEAGERRQRDPPPLSKLSYVELATRLEPDHEEEERHQSAVHPVPEVHRDT